MSESFILKNYCDYTAIPNAFIEDYMTDANPAFAVVYIYALKEAAAGKSCGYGYFADKLGMLESDVKRAFEYWERKGIIKISGGEIKFLPLNNKENIENKKDFEETAAASEEPKEKAEKTEAVAAPDLFPNYTNDDVDKLINSGNEFEQIKKIAEKFYGRPMQSNERDLFLAMYYSAGFPLDVIAVLCAYCSENNKKSRRYIESVVNDWYERGIDTSDKAEEYISNFKNVYRPVIRAYGVTNRDATGGEMQKIDKWVKEYGLSLELIKIACEKTIEKTGKVSFSYTDKILKKWSEAGVKTPADVEKEDINFANKMKESKEKKKEIKVVKASKFNNFEQRDYDPEKLKELQSQILDDYLNDEGEN